MKEVVMLHPTAENSFSAEQSLTKIIEPKLPQHRGRLIDQDDVSRGVGACSISGCACKAFEQTYGSDLCHNCGHKYSDHW
jgi:hypothetical protein